MDHVYSRTNPFLAAIKQRYSLCKGGVLKETMHLEIDLGGSGMRYNVGDSLAVIPENDPENVQQIIALLGASGEEVIHPKRGGESTSLSNFLLRQANLNEGTPKFFGELCSRQGIGENQHPEGHDIVDLLKSFPGARFTPQELCDLLKPMMPRFYSIASSMHAVGEEAHLTVALQKWDSNGRKKRGVCTHYLCDLAPLNQPSIPAYIHPHRGFTLPEDSNAPVIMVGPGTGIAPFRAFMQEREFLNSSGKNWLFFGECHRLHHYFYEEYWESLGQQGKIEVDLAFSRDQEHKIYVQHRMLEKGKELYRWLEEGAYFYVCGDAARMAKDVDAALHELVRVHGAKSDDQAADYVKTLKKTNRYLRDVY